MVESCCLLCKNQNILQVAALIKEAEGIITVDTGVVHLADAFQKKMLIFYAQDKYGTPYNHIFWASCQPTTHSLYSKDMVKDISVKEILDQVQEILCESEKIQSTQ